jgi:3-oxoacyl-[acyl-carrier-protein] synthase-3
LHYHPRYAFPGYGKHFGAKIGAKNAWGFDLQAACSGFIFGLPPARSLLKAANTKKY